MKKKLLFAVFIVIAIFVILKYKITDREKEIIRHIIDQKSNFEIAEELNISKRTVETHRKNIMLKLDVKNSIGIAVKCIENKILD